MAVILTSIIRTKLDYLKDIIAGELQKFKVIRHGQYAVEKGESCLINLMELFLRSSM